MSQLREGDYLYCEFVKGDIYRVPVKAVNGGQVIIDGTSVGLPPSYPVVYDFGGFYVTRELFTGVSFTFYEETNEWLVKYQDSLSLRVSQSPMQVYFVLPVKRGKKTTRALVVADNGSCFHTMIPTFPELRFGNSLVRLRMELEVVTLYPVKGLLDRVQKAREADPTLV